MLRMPPPPGGRGKVRPPLPLGEGVGVSRRSAREAENDGQRNRVLKKSHVRSLRVGDCSRERLVLRGWSKCCQHAAVDRKLGRCADCPADRDEALYDALRSWRAERAKALSQPAYCVFTDATLVAIAEQRPQTVAALVAIPGIGQGKLDRFGDEVLTLVGSTATV